jgi:hypothetical protein
MADGVHVRGGRHIREPRPRFPAAGRVRPRPGRQGSRQRIPGRAIGRLLPGDVVVLVRYLAQHYHRMSQEG